MGVKKVVLTALFIGVFLISFIKYDGAPIKSAFSSGNFFVSVTPSCRCCFTYSDSLFLKKQQGKMYKDSLQLETNFYGIDGVIGLVKYDVGYYKDFLDGYHSRSYYVTIGRIFFGPFGEESISY